MIDLELGDILDRHDSIGWLCACEEGRKQCGLSASARAGDENIRARGHQCEHRGRRNEFEETGGLEVADRQPAHARKSNRQQCASRRDGRKYGVNPDAVMQPNVNARRRLVDVPPAEGDQPNGEFAKFGFAERQARLANEAITAIEPQLPRAVDENIRHRSVGE